jgi:hypothetical protein
LLAGQAWGGKVVYIETSSSTSAGGVVCKSAGSPKRG